MNNELKVINMIEYISLYLDVLCTSNFETLSDAISILDSLLDGPALNNVDDIYMLLNSDELLIVLDALNIIDNED